MPAISDLFQNLNLEPFWQIILAWWWLPLPFLFFPLLQFYYLFWRRVRYDATVERILLEIKIPREVIKPIKAMEYVFAGFHGIHDIPNWREKWIEGQFQLPFSLEIVSLGGEPHFYIRTPVAFRKHVESCIYAQYPEAEIFQVDDYTKQVPQDIPKPGWDLWGADMILTKPSCYPIKTYHQFELEVEAKEEKRIDPLSQLLEGMTTLQPGEQLWVQVVIKPIIDEVPWVKEGRKIADQIARRPVPRAQRPLIQEAAEVIILGPQPPAPEEKEFFPPEMKLTPGEREILRSIEEKIGKFGFESNTRFIYCGREDAFFKPNIRIPMGYFKAVSTLNMNGFRPLKATMTKIMWFFRNRRLYLRKRRMFRYYQKRWPTFFPRPRGTYILNIEEVATLFHFPGRVVAPAPTLPRIEAKRGEPPPGLPIEEL